MCRSFFIAAAVAVGLGASGIPTFLSSAQVDGMVTQGKEAMKGTGKSMTEAGETQDGRESNEGCRQSARPREG